MHIAAPIPILRTFDEARARDFYLEFLGFSVIFEHRFDAGAPIYMGIRRGDCVIHLSEHNGDGTPGTFLRIDVDDIEAFHASLPKGYKYARPGIMDQPWAREVSVSDPFANKLIFSQETP